MGITKVTRNYQVTLPKDVREAEEIRVGDRFIAVPREDGIFLKKLDKDFIRKTAGIWKSKGSGLAYVRKIRDEEEKKLKRLGL
ncbi:MAG: AbrB/MazE/SpoVT family DNA-binding domain-containing protein [Candidatus Aenigmarchaeota archaeon]|nr:AbrB/MazE/SpoVT family DNA-binding domain-containing protein [Candidatus Aenigmarchaeota archaeon]